MDFTKERLSELICKHAERENVLHDLMEIMLENLMVSELPAYWLYCAIRRKSANVLRARYTPKA